MKMKAFRAFNANENEMIYIADGYFISFCTGSLEYWWVGHQDDGDLLFDSNDKGCVAMEYIGCKDKNGREICEGDIVQYGNPIEKDHYIVIFKDGAFLQELIYNHCNQSASIWDTWEETEIIGNIYENPEILKEPPCTE